jgi:hypothetical protein
MGQDSESAAEFVMTVRTDHVTMKTWYNSGGSSVIPSLKEKYGDYPSLWKEVLNWPGWKETRKEYLKFTQTSEVPAADKSENDSTMNNCSEGGVQRKRRSRWGSAAPSADSDNNNNNSNNNINNGGGDGSNGSTNVTEGSSDAAASNKRRSRWGRDEQQQQQQLGLPVTATTNNTNTLLMNSGPQPVGLSSLIPGMILPGIAPAQHLTPQQQEEMKELQARLRLINEKMDNLDTEAERVDALPRSDPQRSPSPPPSKYSAKR